MLSQWFWARCEKKSVFASRPKLKGKQIKRSNIWQWPFIPFLPLSSLMGLMGKRTFPSTRTSGSVFRPSKSDCLEKPVLKLANTEGKIDSPSETSDKDEIAVENPTKKIVPKIFSRNERHSQAPLRFPRRHVNNEEEGVFSEKEEAFSEKDLPKIFPASN